MGKSETSEKRDRRKASSRSSSPRREKDRKKDSERESKRDSHRSRSPAKRKEKTKKKKDSEDERRGSKRSKDDRREKRSVRDGGSSKSEKKEKRKKRGKDKEWRKDMAEEHSDKSGSSDTGSDRADTSEEDQTDGSESSSGGESDSESEHERASKRRRISPDRKSDSLNKNEEERRDSGGERAVGKPSNSLQRGQLLLSALRSNQGHPAVSKEKYLEKLASLEKKCELTEGESLFDLTLSKMANYLPDQMHRSYVNMRYMAKMAGSQLFNWMMDVLFVQNRCTKEIDAFDFELVENAIHGMKWKEYDVAMLKAGGKEELTEEKKLEREKRFEIEQLYAKKANADYTEKVVFRSPVNMHEFTFIINIGKNWVIKSEVMSSPTGENEFFPVVFLTRLTSDATNSSDYNFSISARQVKHMVDNEVIFKSVCF